VNERIQSTQKSLRLSYVAEREKGLAKVKRARGEYKEGSVSFPMH
jgi:hypothetical protein